MHTLDSQPDGGVIGAPPGPAAETGALPPAAPPLAASAPAGPIQDVPLGQLPPDVPPPEPPEFVQSRKEFEDNGSPLSGIPHAPGAGGGAPDPSAASPVGDPASGLLGAAHGALDDAQGVVGGAQGALDGAHQAVNNAAGGLGGATSAVQNAAVGGAPGAGAPADPAAALMNGLALPNVPGADALFQPFLDMMQSFGTGVLGELNPANLLSQSSQVIQSAMQIGQGAMKSAAPLWQGQSSDSAQNASQQTQAHGEDAAQRGFDISSLTEQAAAVVQRGNVQLTAVANSLAAQASALAPVALTPPGQATLIGLATEHLGQAVTIVNSTRGELAGYTGQLSGVVEQVLGTSGAPQAGEMAQSAAQSIGQPIMEQAQNLASSGSDATSSGLDPSGADSASTHASSFGGNGAHPGAGGAGGGGLSGGLGGGAGAAPGGPGGAPGAKPGPLGGLPFGPGAAGSAAGAMPGSGFMGGAPGMAGQRGAAEDGHDRTVEAYQSPTGNTDLTGPLGETTPEVIGQTHHDEIINDYEMDQM